MRTVTPCGVSTRSIKASDLFLKNECRGVTFEPYFRVEFVRASLTRGRGNDKDDDEDEDDGDDDIDDGEEEDEVARV